MPILSRTEIERRIIGGELVKNAARDEHGKLAIEAASYDLCVGTILWKNRDSDDVMQLDFDETKRESEQGFITLQPGQMILVISREDLIMPLDVCGTVYSRNKLQKANILALNAGHVDPGYQGPIIIRLINLSSLPWILRLGQAVFTAVFHTVKPIGERYDPRTRLETLEAARKTIADAYANPFQDSYEDQINTQLGEYYSQVEGRLRKSFSEEFFRQNQVSQFAFKVLVAILAIVLAVTKVPWKDVWEWLKTNKLDVTLVVVVVGVTLGLILPSIGRAWRWINGRLRKKARK